ncbi:hypothetical protein IFM89_030888 [Coptis chinensis]|uniref:BHLH domain-containing protein n=1 Tax=Coptis chinensis TaxID=261450 RepID=A0A835M1A2_9MAGN|nr:hypothetical protein IFM89_030888 [Coptis chinensis]
MKKNENSDSSKVDRKTVEKNRRVYMKGLSIKLASLIPKHHNFSKDTLSQQDRLDHAEVYIKELRERVEMLKRKKQRMMRSTRNEYGTKSVTVGVTLPVLELRETDSTLEVILVSSLDKNFMFYQVIGVLEEEGADVVNASFSIVGDKVFHTIHSQVMSFRVGVEISRLSARLNELLF